jgi:Rhodanese-like domain
MLRPRRSLFLLSFLLALPATASPPAAAPEPPATPATPAIIKTAPLPVPVGTDSVRRVPVAELQEALKGGKVVVVDVRSPGDYAAGHAKGALLLPLNEIEQRSKELSKESFIVTYCT